MKTPLEQFHGDCTWAKIPPPQVWSYVEFIADIDTKPAQRPKLGESILILLRYIADHPDHSVSKRNAALKEKHGWTTEKANRLQKELLQQGLITFRDEPSGFGRPKRIYSLTNKGEEFLEAK